jgi:predicted O-methyltransferase YrrM
MYGIDPYLPYGNYLQFRDAEFLAPLKAEAIQRFNTIGQRVELVEKKSVVAAESFELDSIDFVFIDGNHSFEAVYEDLHTWYKRLKPGGLFSGHDFNIQGVNDALLKFRRDLGMKSTFTVTPKNIWWWKKPSTVVIQDI